MLENQLSILKMSNKNREPSISTVFSICFESKAPQSQLLTLWVSAEHRKLELLCWWQDIVQRVRNDPHTWPRKNLWRKSWENQTPLWEFITSHHKDKFVVKFLCYPCHWTNFFFLNNIWSCVSKMLTKKKRISRDPGFKSGYKLTHTNTFLRKNNAS